MGNQNSSTFDAYTTLFYALFLLVAFNIYAFFLQYYLSWFYLIGSPLFLILYYSDAADPEKKWLKSPVPL